MSPPYSFHYTGGLYIRVLLFSGERSEGDQIYVETKRGKIRQKAFLDDGIDPRVVSCSYAWWFPKEGAEKQYGWEESNINILTDDRPPFNPQMGSTNLRGFCCKVYKA
jgi:anaerobic selenocysteine-containing dehydrogenase